jgi:hypothetical protein
MRLRQVALVARDLDAAVDSLCQELDLQVCYRDPEIAFFGLHNALMPVGDTFIEVVSPVREGTTAGRLLDRRNGDGGYMVLLQVDDVTSTRTRIDSLGIRVVWDMTFDDIAAFHVHPRDIGGAIVSFDQPKPPASWRWAGPTWTRQPRSKVVEAIAAVELQSDDPEATARRWSQALARDVTQHDDHLRIDVDDGAVRFVEARDGRGEGLGGIDLRAAEGVAPREMVRCGTRIALVR